LRRAISTPFAPSHAGSRLSWQVADLSVPDVVQLIDGYKRLFLNAQPIEGDDATYKSIVVVFTDLSADRARDFFDDLLEQLAVPSYVDDGVVLGAFYERNEGTAIYTRTSDHSQHRCRSCR
jgi:hypothetical protein